jgi:hypothetical protein
VTRWRVLVALLIMAAFLIAPFIRPDTTAAPHCPVFTKTVGRCTYGGEPLRVFTTPWHHTDPSNQLRAT